MRKCGLWGFSQAKRPFGLDNKNQNGCHQSRLPSSKYTENAYFSAGASPHIPLEKRSQTPVAAGILEASY